MSIKYAEGNKAWGHCERCGQRYLLKNLVSDGYKPELLVCTECSDDDHPQEQLPDTVDPITLYEPTGDLSLQDPLARPVEVVTDESGVRYVNLGEGSAAATFYVEPSSGESIIISEQRLIGVQPGLIRASFKGVSFPPPEEAQVSYIMALTAAPYADQLPTAWVNGAAPHEVNGVTLTQSGNTATIDAGSPGTYTPYLTVWAVLLYPSLGELHVCKRAAASISLEIIDPNPDLMAPQTQFLSRITISSEVTGEFSAEFSQPANQPAASSYDVATIYVPPFPGAPIGAWVQAISYGVVFSLDGGETWTEFEYLNSFSNYPTEDYFRVQGPVGITLRESDGKLLVLARAPFSGNVVIQRGNVVLEYDLEAMLADLGGYQPYLHQNLGDAALFANFSRAFAVSGGRIAAACNGGYIGSADLNDPSVWSFVRPSLEGGELTNSIAGEILPIEASDGSWSGFLAVVRSRVFKSIDGGLSFSEVFYFFDDLRAQVDGGTTNSEGVVAIGEDRDYFRNKGRVWISDPYLYESADNWTEHYLDGPLPAPTGVGVNLVDQYTTIKDPPYNYDVTNTPDSGFDWTPILHGLIQDNNIVQFDGNGLRLDPAGDGHAFALVRYEEDVIFSDNYTPGEDGRTARADWEYSFELVFDPDWTDASWDVGGDYHLGLHIHASFVRSSGFSATRGGIQVFMTKIANGDYGVEIRQKGANGTVAGEVLSLPVQPAAGQTLRFDIRRIDEGDAADRVYVWVNGKLAIEDSLDQFSYVQEDTRRIAVEIWNAVNDVTITNIKAGPVGSIIGYNPEALRWVKITDIEYIEDSELWFIVGYYEKPWEFGFQTYPAFISATKDFSQINKNLPDFTGEVYKVNQK